MKNELKIGLTHSYEIIVDETQTAAAVGNGEVHVLSTPFLLLTMEMCCHYCLEPFWPEGGGSVGTHANFSHLAATPVGMKVRCTCEVIEIDRSRITFKVEAHDEVELIGEGTHERFIIKDVAKFVAKTNTKGDSH